MSFNAIPFSLRPADLNAEINDTVYRDVLLRIPATKGWPFSPGTAVRYTFMRSGNEFLVRECVYRTNRASGETRGEFREFTSASWQECYTIMERFVNSALKENTIYDKSYPYYFGDSAKRVVAFLEDVARQGRVVTYKELEIMAGIHRSGEATHMLALVGTSSWLKNKTLLSSLVVNSATKVPSNGYFAFAEPLWKKEGIAILEPKQRMWENEVKKVFDLYKS